MRLSAVTIPPCALREPTRALQLRRCCLRRASCRASGAHHRKRLAHAVLSNGGPDEHERLAREWWEFSLAWLPFRRCGGGKQIEFTRGVKVPTTGTSCSKRSRLQSVRQSTATCRSGALERHRRARSALALGRPPWVSFPIAAKFRLRPNRDLCERRKSTLSGSLVLSRADVQDIRSPERPKGRLLLDPDPPESSRIVFTRSGIAAGRRKRALAPIGGHGIARPRTNSHLLRAGDGRRAGRVVSSPAPGGTR